MNLDLSRNWEDRLKSKILEKRSSPTTLVNAALHGLGTGSKWGAGLGAAYGAGRVILSDNPDASIVGGALKGGILGGLTGGGLGIVGGPAGHYSPKYAADLKNVAESLGYPGLAGHSDEVRDYLIKMRKALELTRSNLAEKPDYYQEALKWANTTP